MNVKWIMVAVNTHVWTCPNSTLVAVSLDTVWLLMGGTVMVSMHFDPL